MNRWTTSFFAAILAGASAFAQSDNFTFAPQIDAQQAMEKVQEGFAKTETMFAAKGLPMPDINLDLQSVKSNLAFQLQSGISIQTTGRIDRGNSAYDRGTRSLDDHQYEEAVRIFDVVINEKNPRADGALYWKAYALNRIGRRDDALAALAALRRDYAGSHWLNDAQALEAEVKQGSGQAISSAQESNEDIKLMAINSLMSADPERAIPLLEGILKGNSPPKVKDRAMFVLTQNRSTRSQQILSDYAKGAGNPDLQIRAVRYLGMSGATDAQQQLVTVYGGSGDVAVKREIIRALMTSKAKDPLFNLAKSEKDEALRAEAISQLGNLHAADQLMQLYTSEPSVDNRVRIIRSLSNAGASDKLLELIRSEKEPRVRSEAVRSFATSRSTPPETLAGLYASETDAKTKKDIVNGLFSRGDAKLLIELSRKESDPVMKRYMVERLSSMRSKEATDYMIELLK
ncbi:MAG: HEAT repeat domain-containing protein [Terriglobia bacterium]